MKKLITLSFFVALFATSCSDSQSSYSVDSISDKATVMGTVYYNEGYKQLSNTTVIENYSSVAANQSIIARIGYDQYSSNNSGEMIIQTTTDEAGCYSIEIPVVGTTNITVEVTPFVASYSDKLNHQIITMDEALYNVNTTSSTISLSAMKIVAYDFLVETSTEFTSENLTLPVYVAGNIQADSEKITNSTDDSDNANWVISSGGTMGIKNFSATMRFTNASEGVNIVYDVTTDETGAIDSSCYLLYEHWEYSDVVVSLDAYTFTASSDSNNAFTHYYISSEDVVGEMNTSFLRQTLGGVYYAIGSTSASIDAIYATGDVYPEIIYSFEFEPFSDVTIKGIDYNSSDYEYNNPMMW